MKKMRKNFLLIFFAAVMLVGCGSKAEEEYREKEEIDEDLTGEGADFVGEKETEDFLAGLVYDGTCMWVNEDPEYKELVDCMKEFVASSKSMKGSFALATDDAVLAVGGVNSYEVDDTTLVNGYTTYEIGELTGGVTAAAIMQLVEAGQLSLDDTLEQFFPEYTAGADISIYHLLHMQSGVRDYMDPRSDFYSDMDMKEVEELWLGDDGWDDEEFLSRLYATPLKSEPGKQMEFCSTEYHLLAMIIEQVSGMTYADYVQKNIFDACGMSKSSSMTVGDITSVVEDKKERSQLMKVPNLSRGIGDIHSCVIDLIRFDRALLKNELVGKEYTLKIFEIDKTFACGWDSRTEGIFFESGYTFADTALNTIYKSPTYGNVYLVQLHPTRYDAYFMTGLEERIAKLCMD